MIFKRLVTAALLLASPLAGVTAFTGCSGGAVDSTAGAAGGPAGGGGSGAGTSSGTGGGDAGLDAPPDGTIGQPPLPTMYPEAGTLCANGDGLYCGTQLSMDADTLYACKGGAITVSKKCAAACVIKPGGTDTCPCPSGDGAYCGSEVGADANTLYNCASGVLSVNQVCSSSCKVNPPGQADSCGGCPSGNGAYCGSEVGADAKTLYDCNSGVLTVTQVCSGACKVNPPGTPDTCGSCPSGNGAYCGSEVGADANTLYNCNNGVLSVLQQCPSQCHVNPPGTPDSCGSCPNGNGLYCGQEVGADATKLYQCTGGALSVSASCNGACQVNPPGVPDACPSSCNAVDASALAWEAQQLQSKSWSDLCLGFVNQAFQHAGKWIPELQKNSAKDSLATYQSEGKLVGWSGSAPCGAIVMWAANSCNGDWGHIVIANGDGTVSTSGWPGFGGSAHASISWLDSMECGHAPAGYVMP